MINVVDFRLKEVINENLKVKIPTIKPIDELMMEEITEDSFDTLLPKMEPTWITLFPELNVFRFLSVDDYKAQDGKARSELWYRPVILINGYQSSRHTWDFFAQKLWNLGFRSIFALELSDFSVNIEKFYDLLDSTINSILSFLDIFNTVTLIGHSLGGIFARYYIKHNEKREKSNVSMLITIASPHHGMMKSLRHFGSVFKLIFPPEAVELFSQDKGVHVNIDKIYHEEEFTQITMVNVQGSLKRLAGGDGTFRPAPVSEMINLVEHRNHFRIHKSHRVFNHLKEFICNNVGVYKIQLHKIEFPYIQILNKFYIYFIIAIDGQKEQHYPVMDEIEVSSNELNLENPFIIFTGKNDLFEHEKVISISIYRKKLLSDEKLLEESFSIELAKNKPILTEKIIGNQIVSCYLKTISYRLGKEL